MGKDILEVIKKDEKLKGIIEELKANKIITKDEAYDTIIKYLASKDINVSKEDIDTLLKNNSIAILENKISDQELDAINGGGGFSQRVPGSTLNCSGSQFDCHYSSEFTMYSIPGCSATVEWSSWCNSDDKCYIWDCEYDWEYK